MTNETYVIVVTVLEGRHFREASDRDVIVEAKFNGEVLETDPIPLESGPNFNTELAWEVDRRSLHLFRLQKTPIKLQCFHYLRDAPAARELMGYLVLSIRTIQEKDEAPQWYGLLNAKYDQKRPELLIGLKLQKEEPPPRRSETPTLPEPSAVSPPPPPPPANASPVASFHSAQDEVEDKEATEEEATQASSDKSSIGGDDLPSSDKQQQHQVPPIRKELLIVPHLVKEGGYYQIGPSESCQDQFVLSVTLVFAANLEKVVPSSALKERCFCRYTLFGNPICTEPFYVSGEFPAERTSVKIQSSSDMLRLYFHQNPIQKVFLCSGDKTIASASIPLSALLSKSSEQLKTPVTIEDAYRLYPLPTNDRKLTGAETDFPMIGASITLQRKNFSSESSSSERGTVSESLTHEPPRATESRKPSSVSDSPPQKLEKTNGSATNGISKASSKVVSSRENPSAPKSTSISSSASSSIRSNHVDGLGQRSVTIGQDLESPAHHYCFTLDLARLTLNASSPRFNCFLRYSYPFFGTASPIVTRPAVDVGPGTELAVPYSSCTFNFATTLNQLQTTFLSIPLIVETLHQDRSNPSVSHLIGITRLQLYPVLEALPTSLNGGGDRRGVQKISTCSVPVLSPEGVKLGDLQCIMSLQDLGQTNVLVGGLSSVSQPRPKHIEEPCVSSRKPTNGGNGKPTANGVGLKHIGLSDEQMVQAMMELEAWKERQEVLFREQLKKREKEHLQALTAEWKNRDAEREMIFQRRDHECQKMEQKLKTALADIEEREKQFRSRELQLRKEKTELQLRCEHLQERLKEEARKVKEEWEYSDITHRKRQQRLEEEINNLQDKVRELYQKLKEKDVVIERLREQLGNNQEAALQARINALMQEKSDLEKKLEKASSEKHRYKEKLSQALRHSVQIQHRMQAQEKAELARKESELEAMQLKAIGAREQDEAIREQEEFINLINQAERIKNRVLGTLSEHEPKIPQPSELVSATGADSADETSVKIPQAVGGINQAMNIQRLVQQKEDLLKTGVYKEDDRVIVELTHRINKGMHQAI